ncbi:related to vesicle-associated membrane protein 7 [Melanopsichium pennsylvanicum]|uniref:Synaptobrevin homolog YKT6 n=2 Tax=Melanopsichium pennsylvanicum TaxID=63383 RepID=A0AAJ4XH26_9BASI|nr:related to vesicle-associated membrane protein 7 [Melanopsichium pennsylvanicum 4]SNX81596.1 related to vesicle-associated membrane protein 7 [Melanopsichium pennsylvanicum]
MIVLALVAKTSHILAETHDPAHDRFLPAAQTILSRIPPNSSKLSYAFQEWLFHYVSQDGMVYMAVADAESGRRVPFTFLAHVQKKFLSSFEIPSTENESTSTDYSDLTETLSALVTQFNQSPDSVDAIVQAKNELAGAKDIMTQNVEQILSRGERIELLMDRTDNAANQSMAFRRRAVGLRRQMWWKNVKVVSLAGFSGLVLLFFLWSFFN